MSKEDIKGYECRFAVYCPPSKGEDSDLHIIKEIVHYSDGTTKPNVRLKYNYKRDYYITKKSLRNHEQKKEWIDLEFVNKYESTQSRLLENICKVFHDFEFVREQRKLFRNPYIYGADILSTAVIKKNYQQKFPDLITKYSVACFDTETDVINGTNEIIMATISYKDRVVTAVQKSFVSKEINLRDRCYKALEKYLSTYVEKRNIKWELILVDDEVGCIKETFKRAHEWKPDFLAIWNINLDVPRMMDALQKNNIDPAIIFSDPIVPNEFKFFRYKQGPKQKVTASGKITPIKPAAQWHTVFCPSSFYFIDAMCAYRHIRTGNAEEPSYGLDAILKKHGLGGKLKFEEADGLSGIDWHQFMQEKYPIEYIIYNIFDCISMEELDEQTNDLSLTLPLFSGCSDFENFKSQPRRLADNLHYFCLEHGKVIGTTSDQMTSELDSKTLGLENWIKKMVPYLSNQIMQSYLIAGKSL